MTEEKQPKRRTFGEMSTDARILYNVLEQRIVKGGEEQIAYDDLSRAIGRDVRTVGRGVLLTARRNIERDHSIVLECVTKEGVRRTTALSGVLSGTTRRIGKLARRNTARVINAATKADMPNDERVQVATEASILGAIAQFAKPKSRRLIEAKVRENKAAELPTAETLRLFGGNGGTKTT